MASRQLLGGGVLEAAHVARDDRHQMAGGVGKALRIRKACSRRRQDERPAVVAAAERIAEDTAASAGAAPRRTTRTPSATAPRGDPRGELRLGVDELAQALADLEERHPLLGHADAVAGLGIAALAGVAVADAEAAEAAQLDLVSLARASVMLSKTVLTMSSVSFLVRLATFATSSISSALVMERLPSRARPCRVRRRPCWRSTPVTGPIDRAP